MKLQKPEIKDWDCSDHDPIEDWQPIDPAWVEYWCNIAIGIEGEDRADNFQVHVVPEKMLPQILDKKYILVLPYYEGWDQVLQALNTKISNINELNWAGMSEKLSEMFLWEYKDYK